MARKASATLIGGFVVGAAVLAIIALVLFGSGKVFKDTATFVMYFEGSVNGLGVGSPVVFRGVKVGSVSNIALLSDVEDLSFQIPVLIEIDRHAFTRVREGRRVEGFLTANPSQGMKALVDKGLRGQLQTRSFVTGMAEVALDFVPDKPAVLRDKMREYPEIPTIPSSMQEFSKTIGEIPFKEITQSLLGAVKSIEEFARSPELRNSLHQTDETLLEMKTLAENTDARIETMAKRVDETLKDTQTLLNNLNGRVEPLSADVTATTTALRDALEQARRSLATIQTTAAENSPLQTKLDKALDELTAAARSMRALTEYLESHPESLIRGKGGE